MPTKETAQLKELLEIVSPGTPTQAPPPMAEPPQDEGTVCFAVQTVVRSGTRWYQPVRITLRPDGTIASASALREAMPYQALAYEYLQGDLSAHYANLQTQAAQLAAARSEPKTKKVRKP